MERSHKYTVTTYVPDVHNRFTEVQRYETDDKQDAVFTWINQNRVLKGQIAIYASDKDAATALLDWAFINYESWKSLLNVKASNSIIDVWLFDPIWLESEIRKRDVSNFERLDSYNMVHPFTIATFP